MAKTLNPSCLDKSCSDMVCGRRYEMAAFRKTPLRISHF
jgi:hypothetical protein